MGGICFAVKNIEVVTLNENNLIPFSERSESEVRELNSKGGKKSGEVRRKKRDMKAKMKTLLELPCQNREDFNTVSEFGIDMEEIDNEMVMLVGLYNKAKTGDVQAIREIRNITGKDIASAELEIKKKELKLKEKALQTTGPEFSKEEPLLYKALESDDT